MGNAVRGRCSGYALGGSLRLDQESQRGFLKGIRPRQASQACSTWEGATSRDRRWKRFHHLKPAPLSLQLLEKQRLRKSSPAFYEATSRSEGKQNSERLSHSRSLTCRGGRSCKAIKPWPPGNQLPPPADCNPYHSRYHRVHHEL